MRVKQVLKSHVGGVQLGEADAPAEPSTELATGLAEVSRRNQLYFQVCVGTLLLLFTVSCGLVVKFTNDPGRLGTLFAVTGMSIAILVTQMVSLWKQKVTADVVAVLARHLEPRDVRGMIEILFAKL